MATLADRLKEAFDREVLEQSNCAVNWWLELDADRDETEWTDDRQRSLQHVIEERVRRVWFTIEAAIAELERERDAAQDQCASCEREYNAHALAHPEVATPIERSTEA